MDVDQRDALAAGRAEYKRVPVRSERHRQTGARQLGDATLGELLRQLEYKAGWYGRELVVSDRWYASSKTCSRCGVKNGQFDREPVFWCADTTCGHRQDRDENAAVNLARWTPQKGKETLPLTAAA